VSLLVRCLLKGKDKNCETKKKQSSVILFNINVEYDFRFKYYYLIANLITTRNRALLPKLIGFQLDKKFPEYCWVSKVRYRINKSPPPFPMPNEVNVLNASIPLLLDTYSYHPTIYTCVLQVVSFTQVSSPKPCIRLSSPMRATCPAFLVLILSTPLLPLPLRSKYSPQTACSHTHSASFPPSIWTSKFHTK
jgi:hypothetical protein